MVFDTKTRGFGLGNTLKCTVTRVSPGRVYGSSTLLHAGLRVRVAGYPYPCIGKTKSINPGWTRTRIAAGTPTHPLSGPLQDTHGHGTLKGPSTMGVLALYTYASDLPAYALRSRVVGQNHRIMPWNLQKSTCVDFCKFGHNSRFCLDYSLTPGYIWQVSSRAKPLDDTENPLDDH